MDLDQPSFGEDEVSSSFNWDEFATLLSQPCDFTNQSCDTSSQDEEGMIVNNQPSSLFQDPVTEINQPQPHHSNNACSFNDSIQLINRLQLIYHLDEHHLLLATQMSQRHATLVFAITTCQQHSKSKVAHAPAFELNNTIKDLILETKLDKVSSILRPSPMSTPPGREVTSCSDLYTIFVKIL